MLFGYLSLIVLKDFIIFYSDDSDIAVLDDDEVGEVKEKAGTRRGHGNGGHGQGSRGGHTSCQTAPGKQKTLSSIVKKEKEKPEQPVKKK